MPARITIRHVRDDHGRIVTPHRLVMEALGRRVAQHQSVVDVDTRDERCLRIWLGSDYGAVYQLRLEHLDPGTRGSFGTYAFVAVGRDGTRTVLDSIDALRCFQVYWTDGKPSMPVVHYDAFRSSPRGFDGAVNAELTARIRDLVAYLDSHLRHHLVGLLNVTYEVA